MAKTKETLEDWGRAFVRNLKPKSAAELRAGRAVFERAWKNRAKLDIRPRTTSDLVRETREEH